ncbi:MAG: hypothetical protein OIF51_07990 [Cellvibrionaceae bacterium]|nr:hypothetical protein [Cellvibrionaceae bacterium]
MSQPANQHRPAPIYKRFRDVFEAGFKIDWVTASFLSITHVLALIATPFAYFFAPEGLWVWMLAWTILHALIGSLSTTVYSHRLIAHGAARMVSWPVHILFGFIGQVMAVQGPVRRWAAMHIIHHGVDRNGQHQRDPYSATWFPDAWRNFAWSHMLTYYFKHPEDEMIERAYQSKNHPALVWQEKLYIPLLVLLNFLVPMALGLYLAGFVGMLCMMMAGIAGFVLAQHNTWTVNSVTHMWGFTPGAFSSAVNNYIWLGPLGEGNHHADHHDFARDYRNGFGISGWLLDPTRYVILGLRAIGLVKGLHRANKRQEAEILARRKLIQAQSNTKTARWQAWEEKLESLKGEWLEAAQRFEQFKQRKSQLKLQLKSASLPKIEFREKLELLKAEMEVARRAMRARRQAFLDALFEMRALPA